MLESFSIQVGVPLMNVPGGMTSQSHAEFLGDTAGRQHGTERVAEGVEGAAGEVSATLPLHDHEVDSGAADDPLESLRQPVLPRLAFVGQGAAQRANGSRPRQPV